MCISPGEINARKKISKIAPPEPVPPYFELLDQLHHEEDDIEIETLFSLIRSKRRKSDPEAFRFIIERGATDPIQSLACSLSSFKHPNAEKMLLELCQHADEDTRRYSAEGFIELNKEKAMKTLSAFAHDPIILEVLREHGKAGE